MIRRTRKKGFSLIEIVVAILITALIVASLGIIVRSTVDAKILVESEARARRLGPNIMAAISRDLRNCWATGPDDEVEIQGNWFRGEHDGGDDDARDSLQFVTSVDSYMKYEGISSDLTEVGYYIVENDVDSDDDPLAGLYSLYRREDFSVDKRPDEGGLGIRVHDRVVSFRVWYYDLPRDAEAAEGGIDPEAFREIVTPGGTNELDAWDADEEGRLPYAVRVELILDATPVDAYNRKREKRYAVYETLVRLPDYPELNEDFQLFRVESPQPPAQEGADGGGAGDGGGTGDGGTNPPEGG